jgi:hypothetical protein
VIDNFAAFGANKHSGMIATVALVKLHLLGDVFGFTANHIVDTDHAVATFKQLRREVASKKTGSTCYEDSQLALQWIGCCIPQQPLVGDEKNSLADIKVVLHVVRSPKMVRTQI